MKHRPIVVLTALNLEYRAVREHLRDVTEYRHPMGTLFEVGRLGRTGCTVALSLVGKGNHHSAVLAERAMAAFDPPAVLFVGVAGALWPDVNLGDVVVASHVYAYHGGTSQDDGFKARPRVWEIPHEYDQLAHHLDRTSAWSRRLPPGEPQPRVRFGPVAAGEVVQDSATSAHAAWVRSTYNDAIAIEMEAAGLAQAAHLNRSLPAVVVRGISDRADGTKASTDGANWQPRAAAHAAAFAMALAEEITRRQKLQPGIPGRKDDTTMTRTVRNTAKGNAQVGVQAGVVHGGISIVQPRPDVPSALLAQVAQLREELVEMRAAGQVDSDTFQAAERELDTITGAPSPSGEQSRNQTFIALKRLRGLLLDWTELAAKVTAIIATLKGMS
ncbi:5'-methylthioadenosine/S-adenosylhomocysteine nucleosidase family protein [Nucisporomicrobium flavum]|uniref:5'-methylthioadenosine/S-adenosylhomocysteine nucleosidase family protein n=1 Tax=Nucisporomicrobium flavum TaxID=2785915 RepID=UPI0027DD4D7E|nr:5'-methylthioadenosine/S-adenosylhomocysteine nucleosidase [Nucisporomicrobium flavum]